MILPNKANVVTFGTFPLLCGKKIVFLRRKMKIEL